MRDLCIPLEIRDMIRADAVVAFGVSGGKDSTAMTLDVNAWLDTEKHPRELRCCIHSDLGVIEWPQTMEWVRKTAAHAGLPLNIVRRNKGDMLDRWEQRWQDNLERYRNLTCLTLVTPWSSAQWRFCTSELKVAPITSFLKKTYPGKTILNLTGIRREESPGRAKAPVWKEMPNLKVKTKGTIGYSWNPILDYMYDDVIGVHEDYGFPLHPAYTEYGSSRLSCSLCILATKNDHLAALKMAENHVSFQRISQLELASTFSFQSKRWVSDTRPDLLPFMGEVMLEKAKSDAVRRQELEARIPKSLRFEKGVPQRIPTQEEAQIIVDARLGVQETLDTEIHYTTTDTVIERYRELAAPQWAALKK